MSKALVNLVRKTRDPKRTPAHRRPVKSSPIPSRVKAFAEVARLKRMSDQELVAAAKLLAVQYEQATTPAAQEAVGKVIIFIGQLLEERGKAK